MKTEWASLVAAIVRVERQTLIRSAADRTIGPTAPGDSLNLTHLSIVLPAKTFAQPRHPAITGRSRKPEPLGARRHPRRGIPSRIRVNPGIMARLRASQALNIARANGINKYRRGLIGRSLSTTRLSASHTAFVKSVETALRGGMRLGPASSKISRDHGSEMFHPAAYRFIGNHDPAFNQQVLDIAEAEGEPGIQPDGLLNDYGWEAISGVADLGHDGHLMDT